MAKFSICCNKLVDLPSISPYSSNHGLKSLTVLVAGGQKCNKFLAFASKSGGISVNSILKGCKTCKGKGAVECQGCKGTGRNKKNGNIFERWKCFDCQGFGLRSCPSCGKGGLTPEQRGER